MTQASNLAKGGSNFNTTGNLSLTTGVTGTLPVANGGTGATTQAAAANAVLPSQTSNTGKYLTTDGTNTSWGTVTSNPGTVTSVNLTAGTAISVSGGPITSSGSITVNNTGVTSIVAGTGISISGATGAVTVTASGGSTPQIQAQSFYSTGSWTAPAGVTRVNITCVAGGGGGEGYWENRGGYGGYAISGGSVVTPGTTYTVTIGAGGSYATYTGTAGGSSSFGSLVSATGGGGGQNYSGGIGSNGSGSVSSGNNIKTGSVTQNPYGIHPFYGYGDAGAMANGSAGAVLITWVG